MPPEPQDLERVFAEALVCADAYSDLKNMLRNARMYWAGGEIRAAYWIIQAFLLGYKSTQSPQAKLIYEAMVRIERALFKLAT